MTDAALPAHEIFRRLYQDRASIARAWKRDGGTVVGYLCDNVPVELILAAGCLPFRLSGSPDTDLGIVRERIDALYQSDPTGRPDFASSILSQILTGELDFIDHLIIPHNRHAIQAMYRELQEAAEEWPSLKLPTLHYMDKAWSPHSSMDGFNRNSVGALRDALEHWTGQPIDNAAMEAAIDATEETRRLLRDVSAARLERPTTLSGTAALQAYAASSWLAPDQYQSAVRALLGACALLPPREGLRIFVGGSPFDHDRLYALIEDLGATVVAEDHCWGARLGDAYDLPEGPPLDRLAARFHNAPACSIRFSFDATVRASVDRAVAADVDAAIYYVFKGDAAQSWETPDEVAALRARGIPTLHLAEQRYDCLPAAELKERIGTFLASVREGRGEMGA
jgi:benzoyl-CoA reductase/2-hydroxyglutaryl-CoA dehydratase subunit BcrC/BadD/HgdB